MNPTNSEVPITSEDRSWGMLAHIAALAGYLIPLGNIIGPLVVWAMKRDISPFVDFHGKESINFQITMTIYVALSIILTLFVVGIVLLVAVGIFELIMIIVAAIKASNGEYFRYPLSIRFIN